MSCTTPLLRHLYYFVFCFSLLFDDVFLLSTLYFSQVHENSSDPLLPRPITSQSLPWFASIYLPHNLHIDNGKAFITLRKILLEFTQILTAVFHNCNSRFFRISTAHLLWNNLGLNEYLSGMYHPSGIPRGKGYQVLIVQGSVCQICLIKRIHSTGPPQVYSSTVFNIKPWVDLKGIFLFQDLLEETRGTIHREARGDTMQCRHNFYHIIFFQIQKFGNN